VLLPLSVAFASALQFLLAATFLIMPAAGYRFGANAQHRAEANVVKQGFPSGVLAQNGVNFKERGIEMLLPFAIAIALATLASLNLAG
jgi:hypothetical protein